MEIAILGATSQIAQDMIKIMLSRKEHELSLFSRSKKKIEAWLSGIGQAQKTGNFEYEDFSSMQRQFDAIINFVGVGDPAKALEMGSSIIEITEQFDTLALSYIKKEPKCKYIFLSSGAVYGGTFKYAVNNNTPATFPVNQLGQTDWYGIAKLYAETRHRALSNLSIVDIRVFNYISPSLNMDSRFFITDLLRAIKNNEPFHTNNVNIVRDFITDEDFHQLIDCTLNQTNLNTSLDCYTKKPSSKLDILDFCKNKYDLEIRAKEIGSIINATGAKINYYSKNKKASEIGYKPRLSSIENIEKIFEHKVRELK
jgi:nucleoside-diphosphate-sugar epimerase